MSITRNGKIARLPHGIREELNRRLRDGKSGSALLKWLNNQPDCLEVLDDEFESRPITKQNLSEWRQGGYEDWVRKEQARERVQVLMGKAEDLERDAGGMAIADRVGTLLSAELAVAMEQLESIQDSKERWARLKEIAREVYRLRREDHHARKLRMAEEQYERREKEAEKKRLLKLQEAMRNKQLTVSLHGGGDEVWKWTDWQIRVSHGLPMPLWWRNPQTAEEWSELMMPYWREEVVKSQTSPKSKVQSPKSAESHGQDARATTVEKSEAVRPGRTKSNQKSKSVEAGQSESDQSDQVKGDGEGESDATSSKSEVPGSNVEGKGSGVEGRGEAQDTGAGTVPEPAGGDARAPASGGADLNQFKPI